MCVFIYVYIRAYVYVYIYIHIPLCIYMHKHTRIYESRCQYMHTRTYTYMHIYIHTHIYTYIHIHMHIYIHMYIHTYVCYHQMHFIKLYTLILFWQQIALRHIHICMYIHTYTCSNLQLLIILYKPSVCAYACLCVCVCHPMCLLVFSRQVTLLANTYTLTHTRLQYTGSKLSSYIFIYVGMSRHTYIYFLSPNVPHQVPHANFVCVYLSLCVFVYTIACFYLHLD